MNIDSDAWSTVGGDVGRYIKILRNGSRFLYCQHVSWTRHGIDGVDEFLCERHWVGCSYGQWDLREVLPAPGRMDPEGSFQFDQDGSPHEHKNRTSLACHAL